MGHIVEADNTNQIEENTGLRMFVGDFVHAMDKKKRLTIPSDWRLQVGEPNSLFIMPDFDMPCLLVYPAIEMAHKLDKIRRSAMSDKKAMRFASMLGSSSDIVSWDSQGRIRISDKLLRFANLTEEVRMVGALDKIQLWNPDVYTAPDDVDQESLAEAGSHVNF